jgi:hypothetical protein
MAVPPETRPQAIEVDIVANVRLAGQREEIVPDLKAREKPYGIAPPPGTPEVDRAVVPPRERVPYIGVGCDVREAVPDALDELQHIRTPVVVRRS